MHSPHGIGRQPSGTLPAGVRKLSSHLSGVSASVVEESFSRALASAVAHSATMAGRVDQNTRAADEGRSLPQRSMAAIVAGTHLVGDTAAEADILEAARIARWIAASSMFFRGVTTSGHIQGQGQEETLAPVIEAQAMHGSRWHHELKPVGTVEVA